MFLKNWICFLAVAVALLVAGTAQAATIIYDFAASDPITGMQGWEKVYPTSGDLWASYDGWGWMPDDGHIGTGWENADTQLGRSPAFTLDGSGDLTFELLGTASLLAVPDVAPSAIPEIAMDYRLDEVGFIGVGLRDIAADTYVLAKGLTADNYETWTTLSFSATELASLGGVPGTQYTLDYIDYAKFTPWDGPDPNGGGWFIMGGASIPGVLVVENLGDYSDNGSLDASDLDLQAEQMVLNPSPPPAGYDLNGDNAVNYDDRLVWLHGLKKTWVGDSNLDDLFTSDDFVVAFQAGKYEVAGATATWLQGDWNGDQVFTSADFVAAFADGGYEAGPRAAVSAVPEPGSIVLALVGLLGLAGLARRR